MYFGNINNLADAFVIFPTIAAIQLNVYVHIFIYDIFKQNIASNTIIFSNYL